MEVATDENSGQLRLVYLEKSVTLAHYLLLEAVTFDFDKWPITFIAWSFFRDLSIIFLYHCL